MKKNFATCLINTETNLQESYDRYRELVQKNEAAVHKSPPPAVTRKALPSFAELDRNKDGVIDRAEFQQGMAQQQMSKGHVVRDEAASRPWGFQPEEVNLIFMIFVS